MAFYKFLGTTGPMMYPTYGDIVVTPGDIVDFGVVTPPNDGLWQSNAGPATSAVVPVAPAAGPIPALPLAGQAMVWNGSTNQFVPTSVVAMPANPTDGQLVSWSATLGAWTPTNPSGAAEVANTKNVTGTAQTISAAGGVGAVVSITAVTISVTDSGGRPVELNFGAYLAQTVVGDGSGYLTVQETTSGAVSLYSDVVRLPNTTAAPLATVSLKGSGSIGVVTSTRTFKLVAFLWAPAANNPSCSIVNSAAQPSFLRAVRG